MQTNQNTSDMEDQKASLIQKAKLAENAERYEDMAEAMKEVTKMVDENGLAKEEREIFYLLLTKTL